MSTQLRSRYGWEEGHLRPASPKKLKRFIKTPVTSEDTKVVATSEGIVVVKFNPYHDAGGRFASGGGGASRGEAFDAKTIKRAKDEQTRIWGDTVLDEEAATAVRHYQAVQSMGPSGTATDVNYLLRHDDLPKSQFPDASREHTQKMVDGMDSAFKQAPTLDRDIIVYRGFGSKGELEKILASGADPSGVLINDKGFVSCSMLRRRADAYPAMGYFGPPPSWGTQRVVSIQVPKGTKVLCNPKIGKFSSEAEVILPRGSVFRITGQTTKTTSSRWGKEKEETLEAEMLSG